MKWSQLLTLYGVVCFNLSVSASVQIDDLRCEYLQDPLGVDVGKPRLSWILVSPDRNRCQMAYQILAASSAQALARDEGDLWDSGKVRSDQSTQIEYAGRRLAAGQEVFWKVQVWDHRGKLSDWSSVAHWSMGLLNESDWHAQWIGCAETLAPKPPGSRQLDPKPDDQPKILATPRYLRKEFTLNKTVRRAMVYVTALGVYELRLNHERVGDHILAPEWTAYAKRVQYQTYDVTTRLRTGGNAVAATLGNGWYCGLWQCWPYAVRIYGDEPFLKMQMEIEFADGSRETIVSDESWSGTIDGPIRFSGIYEGERYDARREMPGWDAPGFTATNWSPVTIGTNVNAGKLVWQRGQPIRVTRELKPVAVSEPRPDVFVFDFGQNVAGWCRLVASGGAGAKVSLQHGEMLNTNGTVFTGNLHLFNHADRQLDEYTFKDSQPATFQPHFTYHGFRYVEVRGLSVKPSLDDLTAMVFNSDCPEVGSFTCSEPLLNRLAQNILWSQRANYMGVPTDCPQRDERCGYTGDAQFFLPTAVYIMDVAAFFNNWLVDVCEDSQLPGGWFADHAPHFCAAASGPNIGWTDAGIICPYEIYRTYGDTRVIREHYAAMKRYLDWLARESKDFLFTGRVGNGDWLNLGGGVSKEVIGTAYSAYDFQLMAEMAEAIGESHDAAEFRKHARRIKEAFAKAYLDSDGRIKECSQSGYALAFTMGLVPDALKEKMTVRFEEELRRFDGHPATGFIGTPRLLPALHEAGLDDAACRLLWQRTSPSWLYPVTLGATTIWERWDGWDGKNPKGGMNSLNHYAFGSVGEYLFSGIAGLKAASPGWQKMLIQPVVGHGLTWAKASFKSPHGLIVSDWRIDGDKLELEVSIPANTTATVFMPALSAEGIRERGKALRQTAGVRLLRMENRIAVLEIQSGTYQFQSSVNVR